MQVICVRENHEYRWKFVDGKNPEEIYFRKCLKETAHHLKRLTCKATRLGPLSNLCSK